MVTCFNQPFGIKELGLHQPLLAQYPISISKCVSHWNLGNLYNSTMEKKGKVRHVGPVAEFLPVHLVSIKWSCSMVIGVVPWSSERG